MKRKAVIIALALLVILATPVYAIANPDDIDFGSGTQTQYKVFENVIETGDMLFVAEGFVDYAIPPTDFTAAEAFLFEVLNCEMEFKKYTLTNMEYLCYISS